jgi:hypothetical protein
MTTSTAVDVPFRSAMEVERLVTRFDDASLPHAEWTHRAHLTVALWYVTRHPAEDALARVRAGILRLNAAHGVPTTPTRGYHETITRFYMELVRRYVEAEGAVDDWAERANRLFDRLGARDLPLRHYSKARLGSAEARVRWVEPDLAPLPSIGGLPGEELPAQLDRAPA